MAISSSPRAGKRCSPGWVYRRLPSHNQVLDHCGRHRLEISDVGIDTQAIEQEILDSLKRPVSSRPGQSRSPGGSDRANVQMRWVEFEPVPTR